MELIKYFILVLGILWFIAFMISAVHVYERKTTPKYIEFYSNIGFWIIIVSMIIRLIKRGF